MMKFSTHSQFPLEFPLFEPFREQMRAQIFLGCLINLAYLAFCLISRCYHLELGTDWLTACCIFR
jgi:hypothetical protein